MNVFLLPVYNFRLFLIWHGTCSELFAVKLKVLNGLLSTGEGSVVRQRESSFFVRARVCQAILTQKERNSKYYILPGVPRLCCRNVERSRAARKIILFDCIILPRK